MGVQVKENKQRKHGPAHVTPGARLYKTRDGKRLVPHGHWEAYSLYCTEHQRVLKEDFEKHKVIKEDFEKHKVINKAERTKAKPKPEDKSKDKSENK